MQITTKGRYAVAAMLDLATSSDNKPVTLDVISGRQNISLSYLEQIFAKLRKSGLVRSIRGPGGGYLLNQEADYISVTNIIEAVDENIDLRRCQGLVNCNNGRECASHVLWCDISNHVRGFLDSVTLRDVIEEHRYKNN